METPPNVVPADNDTTDDRSTSVADRRSSLRKKALKGAQIVWPAGSPVRCVVRNVSKTGAKIDIESPVPPTFDLFFDGEQLPDRCEVTWWRKNQIGVKFL